MVSTSIEAQYRVNRKAVRIEWGDCDPARIVYFPRYFAIFDSCTDAAFEAVGWLKPRLIERFGIIGFPAVDIKGTFNQPSSFGENVLIETRVYDFGRSSFKVHHKLFKGDVVAVEGHEVRVWAARDPQNPARIRGMPVQGDCRPPTSWESRPLTLLRIMWR